MSKQLAISSAFSVFAMAAFALFATPGGDGARAQLAPETITGTSIAIEAPAILQLPATPSLPTPSLSVLAD